jgi:glycerol-3-phosphate dehydrogenase
MSSSAAATETRPGSDQDAYDLLIVGGGINGAGIARDAAGRGLRVLLCERDDLASATSSASSKLIHGGLRYLEMYEFRLVRESLAEREVLLRLVPHIAWPLRFVLPHNKMLRPAWMVRIGLFLYDHLASRSRLPGSRRLDLRRDISGKPLKPDLTTGFEYSDCWVEDSRLVVLNAMDAAARGATVLTRWACVSARHAGGKWQANLRSADGETREVSARILVNASGPWVGEFLQHGLGKNAETRLRLVKGSHIVVPKLYDGGHAYILQNVDRRIVFAIPYEQDFTLVGTTDLAYTGDPGQVSIDPSEVEYLCALVNRYFVRQTAPTDVVWSYSGVRPLYDDAARNPSAVTRDYVFDVTGGANGDPPLLSIFGGKITTYRRLAEHAMAKLAPFIPGLKPAWTAASPLPGGDMEDADFGRFFEQFRRRYSWLPEGLAQRYARSYGTLCDRFLHTAMSEADLGRHFGGGLYEREVAYLMENEWARTAEDILWRRSKLGLHVGPEVAALLEEWLARANNPAARIVQVAE